MAVSMKSARMATASVTRARPSVVVRATAENVDRRAALLGFVSAVGAAFIAPQQASAFVIPSQENTGGLGKGKGSLPKSTSAASMEGYTLEGFPGTKKPSYIEPKKRRALLAKTRATAEAKAN